MIILKMRKMVMMALKIAMKKEEEESQKLIVDSLLLRRIMKILQLNLLQN